MILQPGFYVVNESGEVRTREVTRGKGDEKHTQEEPIRFRTLNGALDGLALAGCNCAVLCVTVENFAWGE